MDLTTRVSLVQNLLTTKEIPASIGAKLLGINRTSIYYKRSPISDEDNGVIDCVVSETNDEWIIELTNSEVTVYYSVDKSDYSCKKSNYEPIEEY